MFDTRIAYVAESGVGDGRSQAHRGDGQRRLQPPLSDRRRHDGADPAPVAQGGAARLRQLRRRQPAGPRARPRFRRSSGRWCRRRDQLRAALFARRQPDRLLDDASAPTATSMSPAPTAGAAAADHLAGHRHRPQLLARRQQDRVRKRPRRVAAALCDERRRLATSGGSASAAAGMRRPTGAPTASGSPSPAAAPDGRRIGVISADGTGERMLTDRARRTKARAGRRAAASSSSSATDAGGRTGLYRVSLDGSEPRQVTIPQDGSDPDWSGVMD